MSSRFVIDEIIDPAGAVVVVDRDASGRVVGARFDLAGLPRVDPLLVGQPVTEVPTLVERLCGVCPAAHHLAGVRALESMAGFAALPPAADRARRLLHHASAVATLSPRSFATDREDVVLLRRFAKAVMTAVGSPGHFPATAVPGGVAAPVGSIEALIAADALAAATRIADRLVESDPRRALPFIGADVALVDSEGRPDLLGTHLRAMSGQAHRVTVIDRAPASEWDALIAEADPGAPAPRPYLRSLGVDRGLYRVGPVAQLGVGPLTTPGAAARQAMWVGGGSAATARGIVMLHSVETLCDLLTSTATGEITAPVALPDSSAVGVGWVDGPRGLLVHRYQTAADGTVAAAQILTPTAQNERWLAGLLTAAVVENGAGNAQPGQQVEAAIREADPCLPVASAPPGQMGIVLAESGS